MTYTARTAALFFAIVFYAAFLVPSSEAQSVRVEVTDHSPAAASLSGVESMESARESVSGRNAFALSLLLPGLGHQYVHGGDWDGWASIFVVADAALWAGLAGTEWRRRHLIDSYTTLAAAHAGAQTEGKDRDFFLYLASYMSSDEFTEVQLRNRNWGQVGYTDDPSYQWDWESEERFREYRDIRENSESLGRRRTFIITSLVANRLLSGFTALRAARRARDARMEISFAAPPAGSEFPLTTVRYRF